METPQAATAGVAGVTKEGVLLEVNLSTAKLRRPSCARHHVCLGSPLNKVEYQSDVTEFG